MTTGRSLSQFADTTERLRMMRAIWLQAEYMMEFWQLLAAESAEHGMMDEAATEEIVRN